MRAKRGRPRARKPDEEWAKSELALREREAIHYRSLGTPEAHALAEHAERMAADLRARLPKRWHIGARWKVWVQRGRGILHAGSYRPVEARRLALITAVARISLLRAAREQGASAELRSEYYKLAELACHEAADTCGNARSAQALDTIIRDALAAVEYGDFPDGAAWVPGWPERGADLIAVARASGVSLQTMLDLYGRPPTP